MIQNASLLIKNVDHGHVTAIRIEVKGQTNAVRNVCFVGLANGLAFRFQKS